MKSAASMRALLLMCCAVVAMAQQWHDRHLTATIKRRMRSRTIKKADGCPERSIYILDLNDIAKENGMPLCDLEKVRRAARNLSCQGASGVHHEPAQCSSHCGHMRRMSRLILATALHSCRRPHTCSPLPNRHQPPLQHTAPLGG